MKIKYVGRLKKVAVPRIFGDRILERNEVVEAKKADIEQLLKREDWEAVREDDTPDHRGTPKPKKAKKAKKDNPASDAEPVPAPEPEPAPAEPAPAPESAAPVEPTVEESK